MAGLNKRTATLNAHASSRGQESPSDRKQDEVQENYQKLQVNGYFKLNVIFIDHNLHGCMIPSKKIFAFLK